MVPVVPASESVWQLPQFVSKITLPAASLPPAAPVSVGGGGSAGGGSLGSVWVGCVSAAASCSVSLATNAMVVSIATVKATQAAMNHPMCFAGKSGR